MCQASRIGTHPSSGHGHVCVAIVPEARSKREPNRIVYIVSVQTGHQATARTCELLADHIDSYSRFFGAPTDGFLGMLDGLRDSRETVTVVEFVALVGRSGLLSQAQGLGTLSE